MDQARPEGKEDGGESAVTMSPSLLLQRLKIEAHLKRFGAQPHVNRNQIRLQARDHLAIITVSKTVEGVNHVQVEAVTEEILLDESLAEFVRARNEQIKPIQIEVTDNRVVRVVWRNAFPNDVEPARVVEALRAVAAVVELVQTTLREDFLLAEPGRSLVSQEAKKEAE
jgi:hypothetical protein